MHICVGNLTIIGPDNGLSPGRHQAIIWTNAGILLIGPWGTNFNEILIGIQTFSFKKVHLKMSSAKWRPFCLGLNVLRHQENSLLELPCGFLPDNYLCWMLLAVCAQTLWSVVSVSSEVRRWVYSFTGSDFKPRSFVHSSYICDLITNLVVLAIVFAISIINIFWNTITEIPVKHKLFFVIKWQLCTKSQSFEQLATCRGLVLNITKIIITIHIGIW